MTGSAAAENVVARTRIDTVRTTFEAADRLAAAEIDKSWRIYGELERVQRKIAGRRRRHP